MNQPSTTTLKIAAALALLAGLTQPSWGAPANDSICAEDEQTNAFMCVRESELREINSIRSAPLWMGGPNGIRKTADFVAANCSTGVLHLKDKDGVSFGGAGPGEGTQHSRKLRKLVCEATIRIRKK